MITGVDIDSTFWKIFFSAVTNSFRSLAGEWNYFEETRSVFSRLSWSITFRGPLENSTHFLQDGVKVRRFSFGQPTVGKKLFARPENMARDSPIAMEKSKFFLFSRSVALRIREF